MTKYYISYCVESTEAGANPLWHACLLFSKKNEETGIIEVENAFGFYSDVNSTTTHPIVRSLKNRLGISFNLQDGHGNLQKEEIHFLDSGGLFGTTFDLPTEERYQDLIQQLQTRMDNEQIAIAEVNNKLKESHLPQNSVTRLSYENRHATDPRLKRFDVKASFSILGGIDTSASYTCKQYSLDFLRTNNIITDAQKSMIEGSKFKKAFPRYTGTSMFPWRSEIELLPIRLLSVKKDADQFDYEISRRSRKIIRKRSWDKHELYMTLPPVLMNQPLNSVQIQNYKKNNHTITEILNDASRTMLELANRIITERNILSQSSNQGIKTATARYIAELKDRLFSLEKECSDLKLSEKNKDKVDPLLIHINIMIAKALLNPDRMTSSFLFRLVESTEFYNTLIALLAFSFSTQFITPIGFAVAVSITALFLASQIYNFYNSELEYAEQYKYYSDYVKSRDEKAPDALEGMEFAPAMQ